MDENVIEYGTDNTYKEQILTGGRCDKSCGTAEQQRARREAQTSDPTPPPFPGARVLCRLFASPQAREQKNFITQKYKNARPRKTIL